MNSPQFSLMVIAAAVIAAIGLVLSMAIHAASLAGDTILGGDQVLGLHAGNIVVWVPVLLVALRMTRNGKRPGSWKMVLSGCPQWARYALKVLFAYAIVNCAYVLTTGIGDGSFRELKSAIRIFSSVWMLTYGAALAILYSAIRTPHLFQNEPDGVSDSR
jgi:hypothetical protein